MKKVFESAGASVIIDDRENYYKYPLSWGLECAGGASYTKQEAISEAKYFIKQVIDAMKDVLDDLEQAEGSDE